MTQRQIHRNNQASNESSKSLSQNFNLYNNASLEVRQLKGDRYINQESNEQGPFGIESMDLFLGVWVGDCIGETTAWLRRY